MTTLRELLKGTRKLGRKTDDPKLKDLGFGGIYLPKTKRLVFRAEFASSDGKSKYLTAFSFATGLSSRKNPDPSKVSRSKHLSVKVKGKDEKITLEKPVVRHTHCAGYCECVDYIVTWWKANKESGAHAGPPPASPAVLKKYRGTGAGAPKNPDMVPGVCKHLLALYQKLLKGKFVVE